MNRKTKQSFESIKLSCTVYQKNVTDALLAFRKADAEAAKESELYKDGEGRYKAQRAALVANARYAIGSARSALKASAGAEIDELRRELSLHAVAAPDTRLMQTISVFREFGIQPSKTDITAMLEMSHGNRLALLALNTVLETTKSPLRVSFPDVTLFEKDLDSLNRMLEVFWTPVEALHEANTVYGGQDQRNGFPWTPTSLLTARAEFESILGSVDAMTERWMKDVVPSLKQLQNYKDSAEATAAEQFISDFESTGSSARVERA